MLLDISNSKLRCNGRAADQFINFNYDFPKSGSAALSWGICIHLKNTATDPPHVNSPTMRSRLSCQDRSFFCLGEPAYIPKSQKSFKTLKLVQKTKNSCIGSHWFSQLVPTVAQTIICNLSSVIYHLSSVTCHLTTILCSFICYESPSSFGDAAAVGLVIDRV